MHTGVLRVLGVFHGDGIAKTQRVTYGFRKFYVCTTYGHLWIVSAWKHPSDQSSGHRRGLCGCCKGLGIPVRPVGECKYVLYMYIPGQTGLCAICTAPVLVTQDCLRVFYGHIIVESPCLKIMHAQLSATGCTHQYRFKMFKRSCEPAQHAGSHGVVPYRTSKQPGSFIWPRHVWSAFLILYSNLKCSNVPFTWSSLVIYGGPRKSKTSDPVREKFLRTRW